jgi:hypothetical protein
MEEDDNNVILMLQYGDSNILKLTLIIFNLLLYSSISLILFRKEVF